MIKRDNWKAYLVIAIIILLMGAVYFTFFFYYSCEDLACFQSHQKACVKTNFIRDTEDTTWKYTINGKEAQGCEINVEVLSIKTGKADKQNLEGKQMNCILPLESIVFPESDLARCTGELKEDMQNLIIQKLHAYIVDNLQEIDQELEKIF